jgi:3-hydroxy acid dehydrogenase / malonic semialdehyde reductase
MNRIRGKIAVVTGATSGIGEACAPRLAEAGCPLVLVARREDRLARLAAELQEAHAVEVRTVALDVRDRQAVADFGHALEQEGVQPAILVNNAGLARGLSPLQQGDPDDWEEMIDTNVKGLLYVTRALLPGMVQRNTGHVVNIGSVAGRWAYPSGNVYNASKAAVRSLTETMNLDLFGTDVRVATVDPGLTETEFASVRFRGDDERAAKVYRGTRTLRPEDIADAVLYVLNAPVHVNITEMVIWPTDQRSSALVRRQEEGSRG